MGKLRSRSVYYSSPRVLSLVGSTSTTHSPSAHAPETATALEQGRLLHHHPTFYCLLSALSAFAAFAIRPSASNSAERLPSQGPAGTRGTWTLNLAPPCLLVPRSIPPCLDNVPTLATVCPNFNCPRRQRHLCLAALRRRLNQVGSWSADCQGLHAGESYLTVRSKRKAKVLVPYLARYFTLKACAKSLLPSSELTLSRPSELPRKSDFTVLPLSPLASCRISRNLARNLINNTSAGPDLRSLISRARHEYSQQWLSAANVLRSRCEHQGRLGALRSVPQRHFITRPSQTPRSGAGSTHQERLRLHLRRERLGYQAMDGRRPVESKSDLGQLSRVP